MLNQSAANSPGDSQSPNSLKRTQHSSSLERPANSHRYQSILHAPRHVSTTHPPMSRAKRAAQFSPYAALVGHQDLIKDTEKHYSASFDQELQDRILVENSDLNEDLNLSEDSDFDQNPDF